MSTLRIARRNLGRNVKRTGLALAAIALAQAGFLSIDGLLNGYRDAMIDAITGPMLGHVQLHAPEWREERSMDLTLDHVGADLAALRATGGVVAASARIYAPVLVALGEQGYVGVVIGLDPAQETSARGLLGRAGPKAARLSGHDVLVGSGLAREMGVKPGDEIAVVGQGADGSIANDLYRVAALIKSPVDMVQSSGLVMSLAAAQELLVMPDQAHEITVHGRDPGRAAALARVIAAEPSFRGVEVKPFNELAPELGTMLDLTAVFTWVILFLVFVAAAAGVANTMLMATFERNHELGMLLALGCTPPRIVSMIALEALMLGVLGVAAGTIVGIAVNLAFAGHGVDLSSLGGGRAGDSIENLSFAGMSFGVRVFPRTSLSAVLGGVSAVIVTSLVSSLWPALHAARLQPVEAMRA